VGGAEGAGTEEEVSQLAYKTNLAEVLERMRSLYSRLAPDRIFARFEISSPALRRFAEQYREFCDYPDPEERAAFWDSLLAERRLLEDDSVPVAYLSEFDQGLYGGLVGGEVRFLAHPENGWISSMAPPLLGDWSEFGRLELDCHGAWAQRYRRQLQVFTERAAGKFGVSHFILIDGLNFAFELVGATKTYLGMLECPATVRRAIELAFEVNLWTQELFFDAVPLLEGGTCSNMAQWIPGRVVSESVDPFHMTSVEYFEQWGREPVQRIFDRFDGGVLHLHGNGRHLLGAVASLRNLKAVLLGDDKGYAAAHTLLDDFRRRAGDLPLIVNIPAAEFLAGLDRRTLPGGVFYKVAGEFETGAANRLMERVRAYRRAQFST
jgi:hypothetical protein